MLLQMALFNSVLWLSSIPLCICITSALSIHLSMGIQVASMSWYCKQCCCEPWSVCIFLNQSFSLDMRFSLGVGLLDHMVTLSLVFFNETSQCFPQWLHQFTLPPTVQEGPLFSIPFAAFIICRLFEDGHCDWLNISIFACARCQHIPGMACLDAALKDKEFTCFLLAVVKVYPKGLH